MRPGRIRAKAISILQEPVFRFPLNEPINVALGNRLLKALLFPLALVSWGVYLIPYLLRRGIIIRMNERIVEAPLLFNMLSIDPGMCVLDFGCNESKIAIELASLGCSVVGVDLEEYLLRHPNFTFVRGDFLEMDFPADSFDIIIAVSALEHTGLSYYSGGVDNRADYLAASRFFEILKPGGQLYLSVPFGVEQTFPPYYRVYGRSIYDLLRMFEIEHECFFSKDERDYWMRCDKETALTLTSSASETRSVGIFLCKKRSGAGGGVLAKRPGPC